MKASWFLDFSHDVILIVENRAVEGTGYKLHALIVRDVYHGDGRNSLVPATAESVQPVGYLTRKLSCLPVAFINWTAIEVAL